MKILTIIPLLFWSNSYAQPGKCNLNVKTVPYNFHMADKATKDWYIPYSTHFYWNKNYCNTNIYYIDKRYPNRGMEIQATIKRKKLKNPKNLDYYLGHPEWDELINFYRQDPTKPGVSHWKTKVGPFNIKSTAWMFAVDPNYKWWATYYCGKGALQKMLTEGIDIRSTTLPMDPNLLKRIKEMAIRAGVDPKLVKKIKPAPYKACRVYGEGGRKIIIENEPTPNQYL
jgi:hypothetical protein